jgi:DNA-binding transcriptional MerR regulator
MITISKLARRYGLSRSTLLYYDSIGLLSPSSRSETGYREYSDEDAERLKQICSYREMGLPLKEVRTLLELPENDAETLLENQLLRLSTEIADLRKQQYAIVGILKNKTFVKRAGPVDKETWIRILRSSGLSDADMNRWHVAFEKNAPQAHYDFLIALGLEEGEVAAIRKESYTDAQT